MSREFVLTDGTKFIHTDINGKIRETKNQTMADTYTTQEIATRVRNNSIPKVLSKNMYVAEIVDGKTVQCNVPKQKTAKTKRGEKSFNYNNNTFKEMKWCKNFIGMENLFSDAAKRIDELSQELSDVDGMITDLEHYIEFTPLNVCDGFKAYQRLRQFLIKRRNLKDEQKIVSAINKNYAASEQIKHILDVINGESDRCYKPRILVELFESGKIDS